MASDGSQQLSSFPPLPDIPFPGRDNVFQSPQRAQVLTPVIHRAQSLPVDPAYALRHGSSEHVQSTIDTVVDRALFSSTATSDSPQQRIVRSASRGQRITQTESQPAGSGAYTSVEEEEPPVRSSFF